MNSFSILALLPVLAFLLLVVLLYGRESESTRDWQRAFVLASVAWAVYLALTSELLSLFEGLTLPGVAAAWLVPAGGLSFLAYRTNALASSWRAIKGGVAGLSGLEKTILAGLALICAILFAIAVISPPNTYDSALYHMARVVHWAQGGSLRPYPAIVEHQLHKPIWAETAILHLRLLWGNDRLSNLVQWFSMVGSLVVVSGVVAVLKGRRAAQWLAAAVAISIPMGVLQATSTQNDYVAAYWAVSLAYLVALSMHRSLSGWELGALAAAVGLGALTKGTSFVYAPPFVAWFLLHELVRRGFRRALLGGLAIAGAAVALNLGFWARNIQVYGGPYGTSDWLQQNLWVRFLEEPPVQSPDAAGEAQGAAPDAVPTALPEDLPLEAATGGSGSAVDGLVGYLIRLAQTAGRNLTIPTGFLSRPVLAAVGSMSGVFGPSYADELRAVPWNHEDFAGNPVHLLLVPISAAMLLLSWNRPGAREALPYAATALLTYLMIPIVIGHGPSIFGIRYQLSFFVLWAPVVGAAFGVIFRERLLLVAALGFLLLSVPWVLLNRTRPLVGMPPFRTAMGSILVEDQETILLPWNPDLRDDYLMSTEAVLGSGCTAVGLRAHAAFLEYPVWWLLEAPQSGIRLESLESTPYLDPFADPGFRPCAVICANCDVETTVRGLPLFGTFDSMKVYLEE